MLGCRAARLFRPSKSSIYFRVFSRFRCTNGFGQMSSRVVESGLNKVKSRKATSDAVRIRMRLCSSLSEVFDLVEECAASSSEQMDASSVIGVLNRLLLLRKNCEEDGDFQFILLKNQKLVQFLTSTTNECIGACSLAELAELSSLWSDAAFTSTSDQEQLMKRFADGVLYAIRETHKGDIFTLRFPMKVLKHLKDRHGDVEHVSYPWLLWLLSQGTDKLDIPDVSGLVKAISSHCEDADDLAISVCALLNLEHVEYAEDLCSVLLEKVKCISPSYLVVLLDRVSTSRHILPNAKALLHHCRILWESQMQGTLNLGQQASVLHSFLRTHHVGVHEVRGFLHKNFGSLMTCSEVYLVPVCRLFCNKYIIKSYQFQFPSSSEILKLVEQRSLLTLEPSDHIRLLIAGIFWQRKKIGATNLSETLFQRVSPLIRLAIPNLEPWELCVFVYVAVPVLQKYGVMLSERWQVLNLILVQREQLSVSNIAHALYGLMGGEARVGVENVDRLLQQATKLLLNFETCSHEEKLELGKNVPQLIDVLGWRGRTESKEIIALVDSISPAVEYYVTAGHNGRSYLSILHQGLRNLCVVNVPLLKTLAKLVKPFLHTGMGAHTCVNMLGVFPFYGISLKDAETMLWSRLENGDFDEADFSDRVTLIWQLVLYKKVPTKALKQLFHSPQFFDKALTADGCTRLKLLYLADYAIFYVDGFGQEKVQEAVNALRTIHIQNRVDMLQYDMLYGEWAEVGLRRLSDVVQQVMGAEKVLYWTLTQSGTFEPFAILLNKTTGQLEDWTNPEVLKCFFVAEQPYGSSSMTISRADTQSGLDNVHRFHLGKNWPSAGYAERMVEVVPEQLRRIGYEPILLHFVARHQTAINIVHTLAHSFTAQNHLKMYGWQIVKIYITELIHKSGHHQEQYVRQKVLEEYPNLKLN